MVRLQQFTKYPWAAERTKLGDGKKIANEVVIDNKLATKLEEYEKEKKESEEAMEAELEKRSFTSKESKPKPTFENAVLNADGLFTQHISRGMSSLQPI